MSDFAERIDLDQHAITDLSLQETILNDSKLCPSGNGNPESRPHCTQPTGGQKWWAAVMFGIIFAIMNSQPVEAVTSFAYSQITGKTEKFQSPLIQAILFIVIIRYILW